MTKRELEQALHEQTIKTEKYKSQSEHYNKQIDEQMEKILELETILEDTRKIIQKLQLTKEVLQEHCKFIIQEIVNK